jgi:hypothetical protein
MGRGKIGAMTAYPESPLENDFLMFSGRMTHPGTLRSITGEAIREKRRDSGF